MDAVTKGLIAGTGAGLILYVVGAVAVFSGAWESLSSPDVLYLWLVLLTGLVVAQLALSGFVILALVEAPQQTDAKVV